LTPIAGSESDGTPGKVACLAPSNNVRLESPSGKGANIVFADADLDAAIAGSAFAIFHNQGQACIAGSRLILHESIADEFLDRFVSLARSIRLGDPLDGTTEMGPLTSAEHRDRVLGYVKVALDAGARC
jgi:acyl-CoA reductase-like NAD-dependent aldehyde dehydrogenase